MASVTNNIDRKFSDLKTQQRAAFVTFITAGDPDQGTSLEILKGLPAAGADIIELGMPFTDPSADGPAIDKAAQRALAAGASMAGTLEMVRAFRKTDQTTPLVLMGYFNPLYAYGIPAFCRDAGAAGVDGLIIVDLPPEEDAELLAPANSAGIHLIRLATPTSDDSRLPAIVNGASGFLYYVAVAGVTGGKSATGDMISEATRRIRRFSSLPIAVGFGIRTPVQVAEMAARADAAVVGSAIVSRIADNLDTNGKATKGLVADTLDFVKKLAQGVATTRLTS